MDRNESKKLLTSGLLTGTGIAILFALTFLFSTFYLAS